jgi:glycosyltransferase involved in cell wall biosynthesis
LPVFVSDQGGPREVTDDDITGRVLAANDPTVWSNAIDALLNDEPRRSRMSRSAVTRMARFSLSKAFDVFWEEHFKAVARRERVMERMNVEEPLGV